MCGSAIGPWHLYTHPGSGLHAYGAMGAERTFKSVVEIVQNRRRCSPTYSEYILRKQLGMVICYNGFLCAIFPTGKRTLGGRKAARAACTFVVLYFHENAVFRFF